MGERTVRLRVVELDDEGAGARPFEPEGAPARATARDPARPPDMRVVAVAGFAGGVGRTTLAAEIATLVGAHARIRGLDGAESAVRVLVLDAARLDERRRTAPGLSTRPRCRRPGATGSGGSRAPIGDLAVSDPVGR